MIMAKQDELQTNYHLGNKFCATQQGSRVKTCDLTLARIRLISSDFFVWFLICTDRQTLFFIYFCRVKLFTFVLPCLYVCILMFLMSDLPKRVLLSHTFIMM